MNVFAKYLFSFVLLISSHSVSADRGSYDDMFNLFVDIDLKQDARLARSQGKHLMVMFVKEGCAPCIEMKQTVLNDPAVQKYYQQHFINYHVNILGDLPIVDTGGESLTEKTYANRHGIWGTPTFHFYGEQGQLVYQHAGFVNKQDFLKLGDYVSSNTYSSVKTARLLALRFGSNRNTAGVE